MSRALAIVLAPWIAAGFVAAPPSALAADSPPLSAVSAAPAFRTLPEGHVGSVPSKAPPAHVAAGERVSGFFLASAPGEQAKMLRMNQVGVSYLFASAARAKAFLEGKGDDGDATPSTCFADGENAFSSADDDDEGDARRAGDPPKTPLPSEWPPQGSSMLSLQFQLTAPTTSPHPVHAERLVPDGKGQARLEMADAWVDAQTGGVRLIGRSSLPLVRVFIGPNGLEVYAARDGGRIQVVVRAAKSPPDPELLGLNVALPGGQNAGTDCGQLRFTLRASRGHAQMATLQSVALLAPLEGDEPVIPEDANESPAAKASILLQAMRRRPYQLSISASQSGADPDPVLSVSVGWIGRERPGGFSGREG